MWHKPLASAPGLAIVWTYVFLQICLQVAEPAWRRAHVSRHGRRIRFCWLAAATRSGRTERFVTPIREYSRFCRGIRRPASARKARSTKQCASCRPSSTYRRTSTERLFAARGSPLAIDDDRKPRADQKRGHDEDQHRGQHAWHVVIHGVLPGRAVVVLTGSLIEVTRNASGHR